MTPPARVSDNTVVAQIIGRFYDTLQKTQLLPPEQLHRYQSGLLEELVRHARTHVPFYRDSRRLNPLFRSDGAIALERWNEIPLLTRAEVQAAGARLQSEFLPPMHGATWTLSTSGSTGQPVSVLHSRMNGNYGWTAQMLRIFDQYRIDPTQRLVRISNFDIKMLGPDGTSRLKAWFPGFEEIGIFGERVNLLNSRPANELLDAIVALRPRYLYLQPVLLEILCAADTERRLGKIGIEKVLMVGEHLSEGVSANAKTHLGCETIDIYASNECGIMASSCPECGRYHVHAECHHVEIVDTDGAAVAAGEKGSVVVTPLYNYAMPLIRYAHADLARVATAGGCRITLPALTEILGKEFTPFVFRGGVTLRPIVPMAAVVEFLGATSFRVVQVDDERCEILLVPGRLRREEMRFDAMTELLRKLWWNGLKVDYRIVDHSAMAWPGKIKLYDRQLGDASSIGGSEPADIIVAATNDAVASPNPYDVYQQFFAPLERTEWLRRSALDSYRDSLRRRLVSFAHHNSPFYRDRLQPLFRKGSEPSLEAWQEIPILRRADLENEIERINPVEVPAKSGQVTTLRTSGSTGRRLSFRTCAQARIAAECMMHRLYRWHGFDTSLAMASIRYYGSGQRIYPDGITESRWSYAGHEGPHHTLDLRHPVADLADWLARRGPNYLLTFPSIAYDIAQLRKDGHCGDLALSKIVGISETVTPAIREVVRRHLGCEIAQIYACSEMGCIALQSPVDEQCLVCEETVFVEILDDDDRPVEPGGTGRVILTSLYNYATPFIRYEIGDYATLATEPCPSGRALMRLERIDGRRRNALMTKDRNRVWPHQIAVSELSRMLSSAHFQIDQPSERTIKLLCAVEGHAMKPDVNGVRAMFAGLLGQPVNVSIEAVDAIPRSAGGKRELIVSSVD